MRRFLPLLGLILMGVSAVPRLAAAQPARFSIMGIRLYMSAEEVLTTLYAQGVSPDLVQEQVHSCALHAAVACTVRITAPLRDGQLDVRLTDAPPGFNDGREAVMAVRYTIADAHPARAAVRLSAEERFGSLHDGPNGVWCAPAAGAGCPADHPRMSLEAAPDGAEVLSLTDLGLPARLAPELPH